MQTKEPKVIVYLLASVLTLFLVGLSPIPQLLAASSTSSSPSPGETLNAVQLSIKTQNISIASSYDLVAYNSSGVEVASYTGQYPQVTLEVPSGTYLFAATVTGRQSTVPTPVCCVCAQTGGVSSPPAGTSAKTSSSAGTAIIYPCGNYSQPEEYGYSVTQVSGPASLTIATQVPSSIPTTNVSVSVSFKNGTAVSGAYVDANPVGTYIYWGDYSSLTMYAQTGDNGVAHLTVPAVPLVLSASYDVQVNLPEGQSTVQVNVGGQTVNVTLYYSPNYIYLTASALLLPPETSVSMVLTAQQQPVLVPYAEGSGVSNGGAPTVGAATASPGTAQAVTSPQGAAQTANTTASTTISPETTTIPPFPASYAQSSSPSNPPATTSSQTTPPAAASSSGVSVFEIGTLALAGAIAAIVGIAISKTRH